MKLVELSIKNYRSIIAIENAQVASFQALIGENNAGKLY
jgi:AAA15 family ATPase/GTPase